MGKVRLAGKVAGWIEFRQFINLGDLFGQDWKLPDAAHWQTGQAGLGRPGRTSHPQPDQLDPYLAQRAQLPSWPGPWDPETKRP